MTVVKQSTSELNTPASDKSLSYLKTSLFWDAHYFPKGIMFMQKNKQ